VLAVCVTVVLTVLALAEYPLITDRLRRDAAVPPVV
jgi:hypothetical protein